MKSVMITDKNKIEIREKEKPFPKENEALIRVRYCGICGSDLQTFTFNQPFATYPRIPGHEFSGEIVSVPENKLGLEEGMHVTCNPYFNCGHCYPCENGNVNCCVSNETMGVQRDGSFQEYITMPLDRIYKSSTLSLKQLACVEPFTIGYHAVKRGQIKKGDKVLVLGAGAIGLFALASAKIKGGEVYIADFISERLKYAEKMGANGTIDLSQINIIDAVKNITNDTGMDVVIEATGVPDSFLNALNTVCYHGKIILIGNGTHEVQFNQSQIIKKEITIYGSRNSLKEDFLEVIDFFEKGEVDPLDIVTNVYPFESAIDAFNDLLNNKNSMLKVLVEF